MDVWRTGPYFERRTLEFPWKNQHPQVKAAFRAAMKLDAKQGEQKLEQLARWLERDHPSASASLRERLVFPPWILSVGGDDPAHVR